MLLGLTAFAASAAARDLTAFGEPLGQMGAKAQGHTWGNTPGVRSLSAALPGGTGNAQAPFTAGVRDPILDILLGAEAAPAASRSACEHSTTDFCYDLSDRRIVYRPARGYMPRLEGFVAENVSLRRNAIRFKYSFR